MATTGKRNAETGQRRRSILVSVDKTLDPTPEKKDNIGKSGRKQAHSNRKINSNPDKCIQTDSSNRDTSIGTEISCQSPNKLGHSSSGSSNTHNRKKKPEKSNGEEGRCSSQALNSVASNLRSLSTISTPISASTLTPTIKSIPSSDFVKTSKLGVCKNITSPINTGSSGLNEPNQHTKGSFSQGIAHNNTTSESQQYGKIHVPLITPMPHQFWYNQLIPNTNFSHIIPPPPDYFPDSKASPNAQKQDYVLSGGIPSAHLQFNLSSAGNVGNNLGLCSPTIINCQVPYFQPYSLRNYELSTLNVINYLIPNSEFRLKVSNVVNDLRSWLEQSKIPLLVFPYGSTSTGFADQFSDVDIALIPKQYLSSIANCGDTPISGIFTKPPGLILQELLSLLQNESLDILDSMNNNKSNDSLDNMRSIKDSEDKIKEKSTNSSTQTEEIQKPRNPFTCIQDITSAHIPIIRMLHTHTDMVLDISIALPSIKIQEKIEQNGQISNSLQKILPIQKANSLQIIQSRLGILTWYARMDPRVVHVVVLTKVWTRFRGLRNTLNGFPGGYAWTICVIYFFQKIGILPVIDANEFLTKSHSVLSAIFKNVPEYSSFDNTQGTDKPDETNSKFSSVIDNSKVEGGIYMHTGVEKNGKTLEENHLDDSFPSLVTDLDQEEATNYMDMEEVSNGNCDTETASGSAGIAEQASSSDSNFDSETDKGLIEKDGTAYKMLYLDVVKGGKLQYKTELDRSRGRNITKPSSSSRYSISEDNNFEGSLLSVRNLNLDKSPEERETLVESSRSSIGSTACTYSLSPGILSSDNMCINCSDPKCSGACSQSNTVSTSISGYSLDGIDCRSATNKVEFGGNKEGNYSTNTKDYRARSNGEVITDQERNHGFSSTSSLRDIFDVDELFSSPPIIINNVKTIEESKFLKFTQSHTLFYRFLKFIETHLWTTVIDISSPDIINTTTPGICCDIRNPFPGPPACRPIFDENNKKHLRNEIQRAIQIIQSPFGDFSSICGGYLNLSADNPKGPFGGVTGTRGNILGMGLGLPLSNVNTVKQRISSHQHIGAFEHPPIHFIGYNPGNSCGDQNNGNLLFNNQVPVANLYSDSPQHLILPSITVPLHIPPPPPPPPPKIKQTSVLGVIRRNSFETVKNKN